MIITIQAWVYKHIIMVHHLGILVLGFDIHTIYLIGIMRWRDEFYIHPTNGVHRDIHFYSTMIL